MQKNSESGTRMVLNVTDTERTIATKVKSDFKIVLDRIDKAIKIVIDLKNAIVEQHPSKEELKQKYFGRMLRYRNKIRDAFNDFLTLTRSSLERLSGISDPDMIKLREIIIAEIGELSQGAEALMDLLKECDRDEFSKTLEQIVSQMQKRQKSIIDVIDSQLFNHIDHDILGKMKISELQFKIRRRARIIKQLARNN
jgi:hypothetical protein